MNDEPNPARVVEEACDRMDAALASTGFRVDREAFLARLRAWGERVVSQVPETTPPPTPTGETATRSEPPPPSSTRG